MIHVEDPGCTCGEPPTPYVVRSSPAFDQWVERHATETCTGDHQAEMVPCWQHLRAARQTGLADARARGLAPV